MATNPNEKRLVARAGLASFLIGVLPAIVGIVAQATLENDLVGLSMVSAFVIGPFVGGKLLPRSRFSHAFLVALSFVLGFVGSQWILVLVGPYTSEEGLSAIFWTVYSPVAVLIVTMVVYLVSRWWWTVAVPLAILILVIVVDYFVRRWRGQF